MVSAERAPILNNNWITVARSPPTPKNAPSPVLCTHVGKRAGEGKGGTKGMGKDRNTPFIIRRGRINTNRAATTLCHTINYIKIIIKRKKKHNLKLKMT